MGVRRSVSRAVRGVLSRLPLRPPQRPTLSVVVDAARAGDQLRECLTSVLASTGPRLEIVLLAPDAGARRLVAELADERIRRVPPQAWTEIARGRYVTFCHPDDVVPRAGYATLIASLDKTGSDFAVGAARRNRFGRRSRVPGTAAAHAVERLGVNLESAPEAIGDLVVGNRAFRTEFARAVFPEAPPDTPAVIRSYLRARSFDLLSATTYEVRIGSEISVGLEDQGDNLEDWIATTASIKAVLDAEAGPPVRAAWLARVLDVELSDFVPYAASHDQAYADQLREAVRDLYGAADAATLARVRVERKLLLELVARGDWDDADRLREHVRLNGSPPPTRVAAGRVLAQLPVLTEIEWSESLLELAEQQTALAAGVQRVRWSERQLIIEGWAYVNSVDLSDRSPRLRLWLRELTSGEQIPLEPRGRVDPSITRLANQPNHRYDHAGFTAVLDWRTLPPDAGGSNRWQLRVEVEIDGVVRAGPVRGVLKNGMGDRFGVSPVIDPVDPERLVALVDPTDGFLLVRRTDALRAVLLGDADGQVSGCIRVFGSEPAPDQVLLVRKGRTIVIAATKPGANDQVEFKLPVPDVEDVGPLELRMSGPGRDRQRVSWPIDAHEQTVAAGEVRWIRSVRGNVQLDLRRSAWAATAVRVDDASTTVEVETWGLQELGPVVLRGADLAVPATEQVAAGAMTLRFPSSAPSRWSDRVLPLPSGDYRVIGSAGQPLTVSPGLVSDLPQEGLTTTHRITAGRSGDQLVLTLGAPLADDELGWVARRRLAERYRQTAYAPSDQVYFQCYRGEFATDSQLAIHQELRRRGSPLEPVWGVADLSVALPEGARPVIIGSRAWYEVIGRARYLCSNVDFDRFFRRRDHQRFLQTFHGYPFKSMGVSFWRAKNFSETLLAYECERRNAAWTSILVPAPFCEELYRREYRYTGEVLVTGYPRDDVLARGDDDRARRTRERLGIDPAATVVLYAPTWRESAASSSWTAAHFDALDLAAMAQALGPDHVVLLRGHHFTRGTSEASVLDVTGYPEINDLILAADVAILDYSSLRFDWLLTGKPMIFFVPDLQEYLGQRSALFDYAPTAPGPWLSTTDEVVEALRDLNGIDVDYAAARRAADAEFNGLNDGGATRRVVDAFFDRSDLTG